MGTTIGKWALRRASGLGVQEPVWSTPPTILEYLAQWERALFPVQRFILKLYYGLELSERLPENETDQIVVRDEALNVLYRFTELEYLRYLHSEGRCSVGEPGRAWHTLTLVMGRRTGSVPLTSAIATYEVAKLLSLGDPHAYFGMAGGCIHVLSLVAKEPEFWMADARRMTTVCEEHFKPYLAKAGSSSLDFVTPQDLVTKGLRSWGEPSLSLRVRSAKGAVTAYKRCYAVLMKDVASWKGKLAEKTYNELVPGTAAFSQKDPSTGRNARDPGTGQEARVESKVLITSMPGEATGFLFDQFRYGMDHPDFDRLSLRLPSWEVNPTLPVRYLEEKRRADPVAYWREYGACFDYGQV